MTTIVLGLTAGIFFTWSVSMTPGLALLHDKAYLEAFQKLNQAIINPAFFICFFGSLFLLFITCILQYRIAIDQRFWLCLIAAVGYFMGVMVITVIGNIPLNNMLAGIDTLALGDSELSMARSTIEDKWNMYNHIRTLSSGMAFLLMTLTLFSSTKK